MTAGNPCGTATTDVGLKPDLHEVLVSVNILYFAGLREALGQSSEQLSLPAQVGSVGQLHAHLAARGGVWAALSTTKNLRIAVNRKVAAMDAPVKDGDEVAFFPPVTGG